MTRRTVSMPKKSLLEKPARSFKVKVGGQVFQGFVVRKGDKYYAYQNLCQHLPVTLDLEDEQFFTHDRTHLQCHMHGAVYQIETGLCVEGPCVGAKLVPLELEEEESRLVVTIPDTFGK